MPNDNGKFSDSVLWDKAVVRGHKIIEKQRHFDLGDKPETWLARQLRGEQAKQAIHQIK